MINIYSNLALQLSTVVGVKFNYDEYFNFKLRPEGDVNLVVVFQSLKPIRSKEILLGFLRAFIGNSKIFIVTDDVNFFSDFCLENNLSLPVVNISWLVNDQNLNLKNLRRFQNPFNKKGLSNFDSLLKSFVKSSNYPKLKVVCCDFDNTLWRGVIGEFDQYEGVFVDNVGADHLKLQRLLLLLKEKGILLVLTTKNNFEDVEDFFKQNPEMPLSFNDFVMVQANWNTKVQNIIQACDRLNLGLDSVLFIDDSDLEVLLVENELSIESFQFTEQSSDEGENARLNFLFSNLRISESLLNRSVDKTQQYLENFKRDEVVLGNTDKSSLDPFVMLGIELTYEINSIDLLRVSEMSEKTNQFNANKRPLSVQEITELIKSGEAFITCSAIDKFGDYGIIAYMHIKDDRIENYVMSCRALSRGIEERFLAFALEQFPKVESIVYKRTSRNSPILSFINQQSDKVKILTML